jgi:hypothetical protein
MSCPLGHPDLAVHLICPMTASGQLQKGYRCHFLPRSISPNCHPQNCLRLDGYSYSTTLTANPGVQIPETLGDLE